MHTGFWWGDLKEGDHWEDLGVGGRIILNGSSSSGMGRMDWVAVAQDREKWRVPVNTVMNSRVP